MSGSLRSLLEAKEELEGSISSMLALSMTSKLLSLGVLNQQYLVLARTLKQLSYLPRLQMFGLRFATGNLKTSPPRSLQQPSGPMAQLAE